MSRIIFFAILILGIIFSVYLVSQKTSFFSKASPDTTPRNLTISNISEGGFSVSWVTTKPTIAVLKYSEDSSFKFTAYDERDATDPKARLTHFVVLKGLKSQHTYYLKIEDKTFQQVTGPTLENAPPAPVLVYGKIKKTDGEPAEGIIYLKLPDSTTLSTYLRDGNFLITASNARISDLSSYSSVKMGDLAEVWVDEGGGEIIKKQIIINSNEKIEDIVLEDSMPHLEEEAQQQASVVNQPDVSEDVTPPVQQPLSSPLPSPSSLPVPSQQLQPVINQQDIFEDAVFDATPLVEQQQQEGSTPDDGRRVLENPADNSQVEPQNWIEKLWKSIIEIF